MFLLQTDRIIIKSILTPHYSVGNSNYYSLISKDTHEEIGYICIQNFDYKKGTGNLAYRTFTKFQNKGFMKEVLSKLVEIFFIIFPLVTLKADIRPDNLASLKVIKYIPNLIDKTIDETKYINYIIRKGI